MNSNDGLPPAQRWRALLTLALAVGVSVLDGAIANIALPTISANLHVSPAASVWVVNAYQISVIGMLLPFASLGDIFGYRRVYAAGLAVFTLASLGCTLSTSLPMLVAARALQGLGCAGIVSVNTALIRFIFPRNQLGRGLGINALIVAFAAAVGPSVAAGILAVANWPWLFAVNVPIGALALLLVRALPRPEPSRHPFDFASAALNAVTFVLFIATVDGLGYAPPSTLALEAAATLVAGTVFVRRQLLIAAPILPVDLFRRPIFTLTVATSVSSFVAQTAAYVALPFLFETAQGHSQVMTGLMMTPWPVAVGLVAPFAGRLADRFPAGILGGIGLSVMTLGLGLLLAMPAVAAAPDVMWRMALAGAGFALFQAPNNRQMISSVPHERSGAGSGMLSTARMLGQTSGAAMVAVLFNATAAAGVGAGARGALVLAVGFGALGALCSSLRLVRR